MMRDDLERAVLGMALVANDPSRYTALDPELFANRKYRWILKAIGDAFESERENDIIFVSDLLEQRLELDFIGGLEELDALTSGIMRNPKPDAYVRKLEEFRTADLTRKAFISGLQAMDAGESVDVARERFEQTLPALGGGAMDYGITLLDAFEADMDDLDLIIRDPSRAYGVRTRFTGFDDKTLGLHPGDLVVVGARPSVGKTSFCLSVMNAAGAAGVPVTLFSYEMPRKTLAKRWTSHQLDLDLQKLRNGRLSNDEQVSIANLRANPPNFPIRLVDRCPPTAAAIRGDLARHPADLVIVDHLHLMEAPGESNEVQALGSISRALKLMALQMEVPVLILAQLNRGLEDRQAKDREPRLRDLRGSGSIEQDADIVAFLHRPAMFEEVRPPVEQALLNIAKHRNGPIGRIKMEFCGATAKWFDLEDAEDARVISAA